MNKYLPILLILSALTGCTSKDWRTASRESAGIAPSPETTKEAVLQVYGASTWGWRGWFAIHTWVATKPANEASYTVYEVIGWRQHRGLPALRIEKDLPDRYWFGERPRLLKESLACFPLVSLSTVYPHKPCRKVLHEIYLKAATCA